MAKVELKTNFYKPTSNYECAPMVIEKSIKHELLVRANNKHNSIVHTYVNNTIQILRH